MTKIMVAPVQSPRSSSSTLNRLRSRSHNDLSSSSIQSAKLTIIRKTYAADHRTDDIIDDLQKLNINRASSPIKRYKTRSTENSYSDDTVVMPPPLYEGGKISNEAGWVRSQSQMASSRRYERNFSTDGVPLKYYERSPYKGGPHRYVSSKSQGLSHRSRNRSQNMEFIPQPMVILTDNNFDQPDTSSFPPNESAPSSLDNILPSIPHVSNWFDEYFEVLGRPLNGTEFNDIPDNITILNEPLRVSKRCASSPALTDDSGYPTSPSDYNSNSPQGCDQLCSIDRGKAEEYYRMHNKLRFDKEKKQISNDLEAASFERDFLLQHFERLWDDDEHGYNNSNDRGGVRRRRFMLLCVYACCTVLQEKGLGSFYSTNTKTQTNASVFIEEKLPVYIVLDQMHHVFIHGNVKRPYEDVIFFAMNGLEEFFRGSMSSELKEVLESQKLYDNLEKHMCGSYFSGTALHLAVLADDTNFANEVYRFCQLNRVNFKEMCNFSDREMLSERCTPIYRSVQCESLECADILIDWHVNITPFPTDRSTILHLCCRNWSPLPELLENLLDQYQGSAGIQQIINLEDESLAGDHCLHMVAKWEGSMNMKTKENCLTLLVNNGANPKLRNKEGKLPYECLYYSKLQSQKPVESKREEFRKYLDKAGVLDALTKVLVGLYEEPEKPNNALDFLRQHIGANGPDSADIEALRLEVAELKTKVEQLTDENAELKTKLSQYEPVTDGPPTTD